MLKYGMLEIQTKNSNILLSSVTSYKDDDQMATTTQHSINQPCSESVKLDIK